MRRVGMIVGSVVLAFSAVGVRAVGDDARFDTIPESIVAALEATKVPALSAAAADETGVIFADAAGVRVARGDSEVGIDEPFHIGSCTKAMTATLVGIAVEEGKLRWDMTLSEALPDIAGEMHEKYKGVTIAQLLRHLSGMASFTKGAAAENALMHGLEGDARAQRAAFVERVLSIEPAGEVGAFEYSNGGYGVAAAIVERALDASWEDLMRERLFGPLEMRTAGFGWPATEEHPGAPRGHYADARFGDRPQSLKDSYKLPPAIAPAGDVHCSSADLARFARMHLLGLMGEDGLLRSETIKSLHEPDGDYAAGWGEVMRDGRAISTHDGSAGTFYTRVILQPGDGVAIVAQSNTGRGAEAVGKVCEAMIEVVRGEE
ncbi:MAG: beta-lactamase family protein [Phycisphaeraceae bacterium]|nr:beta-lactamase family protein [Phycisphaerales bacterium]MCB9844112.1 beta-lactamase family protein [Phycisphaeraceae bacterium]